VSEFRQGSTNPKTVYLAGPEVFLPEAAALGARKKRICLEHGFDARFPLDVLPDTRDAEPHEIALRIFDICMEMMDTCDLVIANLTPFRGVSMDVGTAVEVGHMYAHGKSVFAYTNVIADYAERVAATGSSDGAQLVEDFGFCDNLMCEGPVRRSGGEVVRCQVPADQLLTALDGFEICVREADRVLSTA